MSPTFANGHESAREPIPGVIVSEDTVIPPEPARSDAVEDGKLSSACAKVANTRTVYSAPGVRPVMV